MTETFLFIDTETTGFQRSGSLVQKDQGRVCQVAMILTDNKGRTLSEFSTLVKPDDWVIGAGAYRVHGISQEYCEAHGMSASGMVSYYGFVMKKATTIVAHSASFDKGMMDIECAYQKVLPTDKPWFCTMKTNTHLNNGRYVKLDVALQHYCGRSLGADAHDAMADTRACKDIFFAMRKRQSV